MDILTAQQQGRTARIYAANNMSLSLATVPMRSSSQCTFVRVNNLAVDGFCVHLDDFIDKFFATVCIDGAEYAVLQYSKILYKQSQAEMEAIVAELISELCPDFDWLDIEITKVESM